MNTERFYVIYNTDTKSYLGDENTCTSFESAERFNSSHKLNAADVADGWRLVGPCVEGEAV